MAFGALLFAAPGRGIVPGTWLEEKGGGGRVLGDELGGKNVRRTESENAL